MAASVADPTNSNWPVSLFSISKAVEFTQIPSETISTNFFISLGELEHLTTVIRFSVKVPVLSEQMLVTRPIVSQLAGTRTKLLSFNIRFVAKASAKVTAIGRPSGTATTTTVIDAIRKSASCPIKSESFQCFPTSAKKAKLKLSPPFAIESASSFNWIWRGVGSTSPRIAIINFPWKEASPMATTNASPEP